MTLAIRPLESPPDATVALPGSKSLTNRALVAAALAEGRSVLKGALVADDTEAMVDGLRRLGAKVDVRDDRIEVGGTGGPLPAASADLDARLSGTTARFLLPLLGLGSGRFRLDGAPSLRARPMGPSIDALRSLGATVEEEGEPGRLPVTVVADGLRGGALEVPADVSSQFLSGLLLAAPAMAGPLTVTVAGEAVSRPYLAMTTAVMRTFGVDVTGAYSVQPGRYFGTRYRVEPDASAASYFFAAAVIGEGSVTVPGLGRRSVQGDLAFVDVLESMGALVSCNDGETTVAAGPSLRGVDVDLADLSDTAQTLAAVAVFAEGPTRVRGIGFVRGKETDRIAAVVGELRRAGIAAEETTDGFVIEPGTPKPTVVETHDDHRMAMSFALLGLRVPGIEIADPGVVAKTFPGYWEALDSLRAG